MNSIAFDKGYEAYHAYKLYEENPYLEGTAQSIDWIRGFDYARNEYNGDV